MSELEELSDAAAKSLSKHQGLLYLEDINELSDAAAKCFSQHKGKINDMDPKEWVESLGS